MKLCNIDQYYRTGNNYFFMSMFGRTSFIFLSIEYETLPLISCFSWIHGWKKKIDSVVCSFALSRLNRSDFYNQMVFIQLRNIAKMYENLNFRYLKRLPISER